jgi:hypothetical protein
MRLFAFACTALAAALGAAGSAAASTLYAAPDGDGPFPCERTDPCELAFAVEQTGSTDELLVLPGTYELAETLEINFGNVHGKPRRPPRLVSTDDLAVWAPVGEARIADMTIRSTTGQALNAGLSETTVERVRAIAAPGNPDIAACTVPEAPGLLRDVACINTGPGPAIGLSVFAGGTLTIEYHLVNVTAVALSDSSGAAAGLTFGAGGGLTMEPHVTNSILAGGAAAFDVQTASSAPTATVDMTVANSNFDSSDQGAGTSIVFAGGNQTDPPAFVDPAAFDLRQLATSPTIDRGRNDPGHAALGALDFAGGPRVAGRRVDIGADEFDGIVELRARKRQQRGRLKFRAVCPLTSCRLKARADGYEPERERLRADRRETIRLALDDGGPSSDSVRIKVKARDAVGARERHRLRVRLKG